ncbi:ABC transporter permease [Limobrevibacterium gyesilva]|uniref:ABC transporter permease subunit n=1 Tax=Limobrevibacterium gyesilva TaxID=2991712 RepID=A0AA42CFS7_9PROT|nr:ABC transporter permease subunit [Limobrevibacterium gyesilva]MCW3473090.1 ABC transporter permease subunit [Limobrevibacterium gyesilva]
MLRLAPAALLSVLLLPVGAGMVATLLPAFGYLPALGGSALSLQPWRELLAWPGLPTSLVLTIGTGLAATVLSLASALALAIAARRARVLRPVQAAIAPVLATPHAALAIGFAFLVAPSGWIARLVSPGLTGWQVPPDIATVQDPWGAALVLGLCLKEAPYLLLMTLAALAQVEAPATLRVAAALGYGPWRAWLLVVLPRVWPQLRLPVMAVLTFSLSVVDVPLVLGPSNPPTLAVQIVRWFADPDLSRWFPAGAGAVLLSAVVLAALLGLRVIEAVVARLGRAWGRSGERGGGGADGLASAVGILLIGTSVAAILVLALWSFARSWRFPDALPQAWGLGTWQAQLPGLAGTAGVTVALAVAATIIALLLAVACLENERRIGHPAGRAMALLYLPLLVPQVAFLFGMQILLVWLSLDGGALALVWAHLVFVLPYVFLSLADPWRALDARLLRSAACLGAPPWRVLLRVTLPLLARPLLAAAAVGFAVSAGLYLPTLFAGAGRVATLTTEAVTLSSGGDRRVVAATALLQAALPVLAYALAVGLPSWRARRRRGLALAA